MAQNIYIPGNGVFNVFDKIYLEEQSKVTTCISI